VQRGDARADHQPDPGDGSHQRVEDTPRFADPLPSRGGQVSVLSDPLDRGEPRRQALPHFVRITRATVGEVEGMVIVSHAADRLTHLLLALLSGFPPRRHRLLEGSALRVLAREIWRATRPSSALRVGVASREPLLGLLACAVEVGLGTVGRRAEGQAGRLTHVVLDVKEVRALVGPQTVAGVGQEPFGLVAGDLHDRNR
jgi:hypothetical protein